MPEDFVYDGTGVPSGKSDARALSGPAEHAVTAAEWNQLCAAVVSLRTAILTGEYSGLVSTPDAPLSGAAGVRLRNSGGVLQASENGGEYERVKPPFLHVSDYGAVGDNTTDDTTAIQTAIDDAMTRGLPLYFDPLTYRTTRMLTIAHGENGFRMFGTSQPLNTVQTIIKLDSSTNQRAVISLAANFCRITGIKFDANRKAKYGIFFEVSSFTTLSECTFINALKVGIYLPRRTNDTDVPEDSAWLANKFYVVPDRRVNGGNIYECITAGRTAASGGPSGTATDITDGTCHWKYISAGISSGAATINDSNTVDNCYASFNGTYYHSSTMRVPEGAVASAQPGTMAVVAGVAEIVGTGTTFLSMGLRMGDHICVGPDIINPACEILQVHHVVDDTHIVTGGKLPTVTQSGAQWAIGTGAGYQEQISGDNNVNAVRKGLYRFNNGTGIILAGLTGAHVDQPQVDFNMFFGLAIGCGANGQYTYSTKITAPYLEANIVSHIFMSGAVGCHLDTPVWGAGWHQALYMAVFVNNAILTGSPGISGAVDGGVITNVAGAFSDVEQQYGATSAHGGFTVLGHLVCYTKNVSTHTMYTQLPCIGSQYVFQGAGGITFSSAQDGTHPTPTHPTITAGIADGQVIKFRNDSSGNYVFTDFGTMAASGISLRALAPTVTLTPGATIQFSWNASLAKWVYNWMH